MFNHSDLIKKNNARSKITYLLEVSPANSHLPFLTLLFGSMVLRTANSMAASIEILARLPTPKLAPIDNPKKNAKNGVPDIPLTQVRKYT